MENEPSEDVSPIENGDFLDWFFIAIGLTRIAL